MKIFSRDKYEFLGIRALAIGDSEQIEECFFAFKCIKVDFSPEIVLVKEAKLVYADWGYVYFNQQYINTSSLCVKADSDCQKSLIYNERKWRRSRDSLKGKVTPRKTSRGRSAV